MTPDIYPLSSVAANIYCISYIAEGMYCKPYVNVAVTAVRLRENAARERVYLARPTLLSADATRTYWHATDTSISDKHDPKADTTVDTKPTTSVGADILEKNMTLSANWTTLKVVLRSS